MSRALYLSRGFKSLQRQIGVPEKCPGLSKMNVNWVATLLELSSEIHGLSCVEFCGSGHGHGPVLAPHVKEAQQTSTSLVGRAHIPHTKVDAVDSSYVRKGLSLLSPMQSSPTSRLRERKSRRSASHSILATRRRRGRRVWNSG
jgi:hypothetical protein